MLVNDCAEKCCGLGPTGVSDVRDESDRDGVRLVVEVKRGATPEVIFNCDNLCQGHGTRFETRSQGHMTCLGT